MFSSNQQLVITGDLEQTGDLEDALRFVIHKHFGDWCADKYRYPNAFQITQTGNTSSDAFTENRRKAGPGQNSFAGLQPAYTAQQCPLVLRIPGKP